MQGHRHLGCMRGLLSPCILCLAGLRAEYWQRDRRENGEGQHHDEQIEEREADSSDAGVQRRSCCRSGTSTGTSSPSEGQL